MSSPTTTNQHRRNAEGGDHPLHLESPEPEMEWSRSDGGTIYPRLMRAASGTSSTAAFSSVESGWCGVNKHHNGGGGGLFEAVTCGGGSFDRNPLLSPLSSPCSAPITFGGFQTDSSSHNGGCISAAFTERNEAERDAEVLVETTSIPEGRIITFEKGGATADEKYASARGLFDEGNDAATSTEESSTVIREADEFKAQTSATMYPGAAMLRDPATGQDILFLVGGYRRTGENLSKISKFLLNTDGSIANGPIAVHLDHSDFRCHTPLLQHTVVAVQETYCLYIIGNGGDADEGPATAEGNSLFKYDVVKNTVVRVKVTQKGNPYVPAVLPATYHCHTSVLMKCPETHHDLIISFGGVQKSQPLSSLFVFDTVDLTWERKNVAKFRPVARLYHAACSDGASTMYIYGGAPDCKTTTANDVIFGDMWSWDIQTNLWTLIRPIGPKPSPRGSCSMLQSGPFIYLLGGFNGSSDFSDFSRYDMVSQTWTRLEGAEECTSGKNGVWAYASCVSQEGCLYYAGGICKRKAGVELSECALSETVYTYKPTPSGFKQLLARFCAEKELVPRRYDPSTRRSSGLPPLRAPLSHPSKQLSGSATPFQSTTSSGHAASTASSFPSSGSSGSGPQRRTPGGPPLLPSVPLAAASAPAVAAAPHF